MSPKRFFNMEKIGDLFIEKSSSVGFVFPEEYESIPSEIMNKLNNKSLAEVVFLNFGKRLKSIDESLLLLTRGIREKDEKADRADRARDCKYYMQKIQNKYSASDGPGCKRMMRGFRSMVCIYIARRFNEHFCTSILETLEFFAKTPRSKLTAKDFSRIHEVGKLTVVRIMNEIGNKGAAPCQK